jgi:predicted permease
MDSILADLRYSLRSLRLAPGFASVVILTLALGIGANAAIFTVVDSAILQPLPYREPDRLMQLYITVGRPDAAAVDSFVWSYPKFSAMRRAQRSFSEVAAYSQINTSLTGTDDPERLGGELVSGSYFDLLGFPMARGRGFIATEDSIPGATPVVVIGHSLWQRRFGGSESIVGSTAEFSKRKLTVVGVAPPGFEGLTGNAELWIPLSMAGVFLYPEALTEGGNHWLDAVGRLAPGVSSRAAIGEMPALGQVANESYRPDADGSVWSATAESLRDARSDPFLRRAMLVLLGAVGFVLLIACVNVANLLLARAAGRQREIAVRAALGAGRARLARQLLTESIVLSVAGGLLGIALAAWILDLLRAIAPAAMQGSSAQAAQFLDADAMSMGWRVLAFTGALSIITGLVFGLVPALVATRSDLNATLRQGAPGATHGGVGSLRRIDPRSALIAAEVALAMVLLAGAGLMIRSFARASAIDVGFDASHTLTFRLAPPADTVYTSRAAPAFKARLLEQLGAIPGVEAASVNSCAPLSSGCSRSVVWGIDGVPTTESTRGNIGVHSVGTDFFRAIGAPIVRGRAFGTHDGPGAPRVAVINDAAARRFFPGTDPIGRRITVATAYFAGGNEYAEIVGVVGDVRYQAIAEPAIPDVYTPALQQTSPRGVFFLRTRGDPTTVIPAVREAVREIDRDLPIFDVRTMEDRFGAALSRIRFGTVLLGAFGAVALLLAALGIYGVMAYSVAARTRELGIRMALGARAADVLRMVMTQGLALVLIGVVAGLAGAAALSRTVTSLLYEVRPLDPIAFAGTALVLVVTAGFACLLPARRATRVEPGIALRNE